MNKVVGRVGVNYTVICNWLYLFIVIVIVILSQALYGQLFNNDAEEQEVTLEKPVIVSSEESCL